MEQDQGLGWFLYILKKLHDSLRRCRWRSCSGMFTFILDSCVGTLGQLFLMFKRACQVNASNAWHPHDRFIHGETLNRSPIIIRSAVVIDTGRNKHVFYLRRLQSRPQLHDMYVCIHTMHKINAKATSYIEPTFENHALEWQLLGSEKWKTLWNWGLNKNATIIACSYIKNICCHMHGAWPQICIADQNPFEPQDISLLNIFIGLSSLDIGDWRGWWAETRTCTCILAWTYGMKKVHNYILYVDLYERGLRFFVSIFVLLLLLTTAQSICTGPILAKHGLPVARQVNRCPHGIVRNFFTLATNGSWDYISLRGMWR